MDGQNTKHLCLTNLHQMINNKYSSTYVRDKPVIIRVCIRIWYYNIWSFKINISEFVFSRPTVQSIVLNRLQYKLHKALLGYSYFRKRMPISVYAHLLYLYIPVLPCTVVQHFNARTSWVFFFFLPYSTCIVYTHHTAITHIRERVDTFRVKCFKCARKRVSPVKKRWWKYLLVTKPSSSRRQWRAS